MAIAHLKSTDGMASFLVTAILADKLHWTALEESIGNGNASAFWYKPVIHIHEHEVIQISKSKNNIGAPNKSCITEETMRQKEKEVRKCKVCLATLKLVASSIQLFICMCKHFCLTARKMSVSG